MIRTGGAIYYQPPREDGNADNGIQGFGGTFGATGNFLSNGISFLTKNGLTAFATQIQNLKPPISDPQTLTGNLFQQSPFFYFSQTGRSAYFSDWQISIERTVTADSVFRATYHGVVGNKLISRQQSLNQLDPRYWAIYGSLLGNTISSVINNPIVVAAGFKLPYASYPTNLQLQQALRPYPAVLRHRQQRQRPERRPLHIPRAGDQLRAPLRQGPVPDGHLHVLQADLHVERRGRQPRYPGRRPESVQPAAGQGRGVQRGHAPQHPHRLHLRPADRKGQAAAEQHAEGR